MRDIGPLYLNRLEGDLVFVDPKNEWQHKQPNVCIIGKPGIRRGKTIYPIEDEAHKLYDSETEKIVNKLRSVGKRKRGDY